MEILTDVQATQRLQMLERERREAQAAQRLADLLGITQETPSQLAQAKDERGEEPKPWLDPQLLDEVFAAERTPHNITSLLPIGFEAGVRTDISDPEHPYFDI